jgi:hypothetical protein
MRLELETNSTIGATFGGGILTTRPHHSVSASAKPVANGLQVYWLHNKARQFGLMLDEPGGCEELAPSSSATPMDGVRNVFVMPTKIV